MTGDEERWAEALQILRWKGEQAGAWVGARIEALGSAGDQAGVERFTAICARVERLSGGTVQ